MPKDTTPEPAEEAAQAPSLAAMRQELECEILRQDIEVKKAHVRLLDAQAKLAIEQAAHEKRM